MQIQVMKSKYLYEYSNIIDCKPINGILQRNEQINVSIMFAQPSVYVVLNYGALIIYNLGAFLKQRGLIGPLHTNLLYYPLGVQSSPGPEPDRRRT
jgi:hypothetical protein